ncbi:hypothetical protein AVEN_273779-1 [Araneus ventricosus]|uniref:Uncharacterized protein n=1 Tax=Araneus ventricosus TaxID=182803 RepID=A0A4Y2N4C1_ARAVE|nr:hypothetical protein AVEN_273779-1 [Araneus ventricosus]
MSVNARTPKASDSTDGHLSAVPTDCCRLCAHRRNGKSGWIPNDNKSSNKASSNQATDCGNKVQDVLQATNQKAPTVGTELNGELIRQTNLPFFHWNLRERHLMLNNSIDVNGTDLSKEFHVIAR